MNIIYKNDEEVKFTCSQEELDTIREGIDEYIDRGNDDLVTADMLKVCKWVYRSNEWTTRPITTHRKTYDVVEHLYYGRLANKHGM